MKNHAWLQQNDRAWGAVGYALSICGNHKRAVQWLSNYETRSDVESWMVHNYIDGCHMLGRDAEAYSACEFAVKLPAFGAQINSVALWLALENILKSDQPKLALGRLDYGSFTDQERRMNALLEVLIRILRSTDKPKYTAHDREVVREFVAIHPTGNKWARRYARRARKSIAGKTGQWWIPWMGL